MPKVYKLKRRILSVNVDRLATSIAMEEAPTEHVRRWLDGREPFDGAGFSRESDVWDLAFRETRAVARAVSRFSFSSYSTWLKHDAKDFIAYCWLSRNLSNGTLMRYFEALGMLQKFLLSCRPDIGRVSDLDSTVARGFEQWLMDMDRNESPKWKIANGVSMFARWARQRYDGPIQHFAPDYHLFEASARKRRHSYLDGQDRVIPRDVREQIMRAVALEEQAALATIDFHNREWRRIAKRAVDRLMMCQVLKLLMATGRRISHILLLPVDCIRETVAGEAPGVWLIWNETKTRQGLQPVFVPEPLSDVVREAVAMALKWTDSFRGSAPVHWRGCLFLTDWWADHLGVRPYTSQRFSNWCNGQLRGTAGFCERYNITHNGKIHHIKAHDFRHTRATLFREGGAGYGTIKNDLRHLSGDMTLVYLHAPETHRAELEELRRTQQLVGNTTTFIYEKDVKIDGIPQSQLDLWREQGMFVQVTHYGYCVLPQEKGPCPSGDPCVIGPKGDGCLYHLYGPKNKEVLEADAHATRELLGKVLQTRPNSPLAGHYRLILARYETALREIESAGANDRHG